MSFHRSGPDAGWLCDPASGQICWLQHADGFPLTTARISWAQQKIRAVTALGENLRGVLQPNESLRIRAITLTSKNVCAAEIRVDLLVDHRREDGSVEAIRAALDQRLFCHVELNSIDDTHCMVDTDVNVIVTNLLADGFHPDSAAYYDPWMASSRSGRLESGA